MLPPFISAEHDSELYRFESRNAGNSTSCTTTLTAHEESEEEDDEMHSAECISVSDARSGGDSGGGTGEISKPRMPTDEDIAIRAQAEIATAFPATYDSLMLCLFQTTSRPPQQLRYISQEERTAYKRQHQLLLTITERLGLPKGDEKAFAFIKIHDRVVHGRGRSVKTIKEIRRKKLERHQQWMRAVKNMPEERSSHANIVE